jgi:hypothetical protein
MKNKAHVITWEDYATVVAERDELRAEQEGLGAMVRDLCWLASGENPDPDVDLESLREYIVALNGALDALTNRNAGLIRERDAYDARRRENMASCEAWRQRCYAAEARLRAMGEEVPE